MGYVFRSEDAQHYLDWLGSEPGRSALCLEKELLLKLWAPSAPQRVLEVGCGPGVFLEWFAQLGHQVTGLDPSPSLLGIARSRLSRQIDLDRGFAEHLPYEDNAFDTVALITALEFVDDPVQALKEAARVARRHVLLGALNKYSLMSAQSYLERLWKDSVLNHARFFSVYKLCQLTTTVFSGTVPVRWRTCLSLPLRLLPYTLVLERSRYCQWHPFGHFIAMRIDVRYTLQTVQHPVFSELPSGLGPAGFRGSCWRLPGNERRGQGLTHAGARRNTGPSEEWLSHSEQEASPGR